MLVKKNFILVLVMRNEMQYNYDIEMNKLSTGIGTESIQFMMSYI